MRTPLSEKAVRGLRLGEIVYLTGDVITGRDSMHFRAADYVGVQNSLQNAIAAGDEERLRMMESARSRAVIPEHITNSVLYHCGPIMVYTGKEWKAVAAGPTTSARMNSLEPGMIRTFGIRAVIGKGGMSKEVGQAMRDTGCVYLAAVGGTAVSLAGSIVEVYGAEWSDLGMAEAMWRFRTERMGPLIVAMDSEGNSLYEDVASKIVRDS